MRRKHKLTNHIFLCTVFTASRVPGVRDIKLRKGLRPTLTILAIALYFSSSPCQLWSPAKTNFILKFLFPDVSIFTTGEIDTRLLLSACGSGRSWVSSVSRRHRLLSSLLRSAAEDRLSSETSARGHGKVGHRARLHSLSSFSCTALEEKEGTALAWCWLF